EELVDQTAEPAGVSLDDPEISLAGRRKGSFFGGVERHLEIAAERRERRSQLVGCRRNELVLEAVELAQTLVLLGELRVALPHLGDQALDHETRDGCNGGEDQGPSPTGFRIFRRADERKRYQLGGCHRGQDRGELTAPGGDSEPEHREQEEASEARG